MYISLRVADKIDHLYMEHFLEIIRGILTVLDNVQLLIVNNQENLNRLVF